MPTTSLTSLSFDAIVSQAFETIKYSWHTSDFKCIIDEVAGIYSFIQNDTLVWYCLPSMKKHLVVF
jgi:hypothetical protein